MNAQLDEFQIFDRGLTRAEVRSLMASAGGDVGGGNVLWDRFDEADGTFEGASTLTVRGMGASPSRCVCRSGCAAGSPGR